MKLKIKSPTTKEAVGKKQEASDIFSSSYSLYDTCYKCPLWVYVDLVCNDNLEALIVEGKPSQGVLENAKIGLLTEFAELSDNTSAKMINSILRQMYQYKANIMELELCVELIVQDRYQPAFACLARMGMKFAEPKTAEELDKIIKKVTGFTKGKIIQFNEVHKRYIDLTTSTDSSKVTVQDYTDQLALISKYVGFNLSLRSLTLSEYASYIKLYQHGNTKQ